LRKKPQQLKKIFQFVHLLSGENLKLFESIEEKIAMKTTWCVCLKIRNLSSSKEKHVVIHLCWFRERRSLNWFFNNLLSTDTIKHSSMSLKLMKFRLVSFYAHDSKKWTLLNWKSISERFLMVRYKKSCNMSWIEIYEKTCTNIIGFSLVFSSVELSCLIKRTLSWVESMFLLALPQFNFQ